MAGIRTANPGGANRGYAPGVAIADSYDGFLIDLDGVVWLGGELIEGAGRTIRELTGSGKHVAFVTNSPRLSPAEQAQQLRDCGVPVSDRQMITAGEVLIHLVITECGNGSDVIAVGTPSFLAQVDDAGLQRLDPESWPDAKAVLLTGHDGFNYAELRATSMAARAGAFFAATARDPTMPMPDGLWPGTGSILAAAETASGRSARIAGKPEPPIFRAGIEALGLPDGAPVAMVGDRLDTDVGGAQRAGLDGILVAGNESSGGPGPENVRPDHRIDRLSGLLT